MRLNVKEGGEKTQSNSGDSTWIRTHSQSGDAEQGSHRPCGDPLDSPRKGEVKRASGEGWREGEPRGTALISRR